MDLNNTTNLYDQESQQHNQREPTTWNDKTNTNTNKGRGEEGKKDGMNGYGMSNNYQYT